MRTEEYVEAARAFAEAGVEPDAWPAALRRLEAVTGGKAGQLIGIGPSGLIFDIADLPEDRFQDFADIEGHSPLVNPRMAAAARKVPCTISGATVLGRMWRNIRIQVGVPTEMAPST